jgi:SAM-dependent methyltransferase
MHADARYSTAFFEEHHERAIRSAREVVPLVIEILRPSSVVDVGCALGEWLSVFLQYGIDDVLGIDGEYVDRSLLAIPRELFQAEDLTRPLVLNRRFDLAISLEVAEHLPAEVADSFVGSLVNAAPAVVFSAAIPEQDGFRHLNTQWPRYWAGLFASHRYRVVDCLRPQIWENEAVDFWYRQNLLVFAEDDVIAASPTLQAERGVRRPLDVVHPSHWSQVTYQAQLDRTALAEAREAAAPKRSLFRGVLRRLLGNGLH